MQFWGARGEVCTLLVLRFPRHLTFLVEYPGSRILSLSLLVSGHSWPGYGWFSVGTGG